MSLSPAPYPLLPVAVLQVVDTAVVPVDADAQQGPREEAVLSQNHKVSEKTTESLDHPWKQKNVQGIHVTVLGGVTRWSTQITFFVVTSNIYICN